MKQLYAIIHPITPFDAANGATISFTWNGNQIYKVRCIVKENESGTTVYDKTTSTMKTSYTIEADSGLENGTYYIMYITVFDVDDNESDLQSIGTPFYCFTTPTFSLSISDGGVIIASSYSVTLTYSQEEDEILNSNEIILYSYQQIQLQTSGTLYDTENMTYLLSGMENAMQYYVRATGSTIHGIVLDTGYISFNVAYTQAQIFKTIETNNMPEIGGIELRSNIISTEGDPESEVEYIDGHADLRENSVNFDVGYEVSGDNSHVFSFYSPNINDAVATIKDESGGMIINCYYREGIFDDTNGVKKALIELNAESNGVHYVIYSNYLDIPTDSQSISFCINRIGNHFDIKAVLVNRTTLVDTTSNTGNEGERNNTSNINNTP